MDRDIKRFLDRFEEVCRKVGGEVVKESTGVSEESLSKAGLSEWDLTKCIFKEKNSGDNQCPRQRRGNNCAKIVT
jgi:hypothetical protein